MVIECIEEGKSFILEAGAGSGKTWTLIETIKYILKSNSDLLLKRKTKIVCITYTNVAKNEIIDRIDNNQLVHVNTIHEFLWSEIKLFQYELKIEINNLNNQLPIGKKIDYLSELLKNRAIEYSQYGRNFEMGNIFHDDVLKLASLLFDKYPKISKIVRDKYPFIFVDEYQDTESQIVDLLINCVLSESNKFVLGFFGDSMQKIYNQGVGEIIKPQLVKIPKKDNYRCSKAVINLLNHIRPELIQHPSGSNLDGNIFYIYCNGSTSNSTDLVEKTLKFLKWNIDKKDTKILLLTHKGIASTLHYSNLLHLYDSYSPFYKEKLFQTQDCFSKFLFLIEESFRLFSEKQYGKLIELLGKENCVIHCYNDKIKISSQLENLYRLRNISTIGEIMDYSFTNGPFFKPEEIRNLEKPIELDIIDERKKKMQEFYNLLRNISYIEYISLYDYIQNLTPFSTKHSVKGAEFNNVLIIIDDNSWNQYKFDYLFSKQYSKKQYSRTRNLFYVCCSRSKDNLAILNLSEISSNSLDTLKCWFGEDNIYHISSI